MTAALALLLFAAPAQRSPGEQALDAQDLGKLEQIASAEASVAGRTSDPATWYRAAVAYSHLAQLGIETGDKLLGKSAAETGIRHAEKAVALKPADGEYRRILGTLCGQVIPANVLAGLKWGKCATEEIKKATELAPRSAKVWLSRGVGNYYLPSSFGGGVDRAIADFDKAVALDAGLAEAHLWRGVALRKAGRNADARKSIEKALQLNPDRKWARQQLEKTPAR